MEGISERTVRQDYVARSDAAARPTGAERHESDLRLTGSHAGAQLHIWLPAGLLRALKRVAVENDFTLSDFVRRTLKQRVQAERDGASK